LGQRIWSGRSRPVVGGKGGGRRDLAQAGGTRPEAIEEALARVYDLIPEA